MLKEEAVLFIQNRIRHKQLKLTINRYLNDPTLSTKSYEDFMKWCSLKGTYINVLRLLRKLYSNDNNNNLSIKELKI